MPLDDNDKKHINDTIAATLKPVTEQLAAIATTVKTLGESVPKGVQDTLKSLQDEVAKLKTPAAPDDKDKPKDKGKGEGDDKLTAALTPILEQVKQLADAIKPISEERAQGQKQAAAKSLLEKYATTAKKPGVVRDAELVNKVIAAGVTDDAGVARVVEGHESYLKGLGVDTSKWAAANPAAEGAKPAADTETPEARTERMKKFVAAEAQRVK